MSRTLVVILLWTSGCASYDALATKRGDGGADPNAPWDTAHPDEDSDTADEMGGEALSDPAWLRISGELEITEGVADSLELVGSFFPADLSAGELTECAVSVSTTLLEEDVSSDPDLFKWWLVSFPADGAAWSCGEDSQIPALSGVGLGAFHPELHAGVVELGLSDPAQYLYGLYARFESVDNVDALEAGQTYVVGYAGTADQLTADAEASATGQVEDGLYNLEGTFLLPIAPATN
jgi:hypothetical protein